MSFLEIILLAVVQGLTEFLPVSSSGHLVVGSEILQALGFPPPADLLEVNIVLHIGTLLAVLVFYFREIASLLNKDRRVIPLLIVGTIPAAVIGIPLKEMADRCLESSLVNPLESPVVAGCMFPVTAAILIWASRRSSDGQTHESKTYQQLSYIEVIKIGALQAFALLPGVSRSGATIAGGLHCGLDRESAGTFAFLLAIPAIGGAGLIEVLKLVRNLNAADVSVNVSASATEMTATPPMYLFIGAVVSALVGWVALWWLVRWIRAGRLAVFAWYLIPLGAVVLAWLLFR